MGRFYYGDIEGKFWVAIQPSNDIENIVDVDPEPLFVWKICNCEAIINESQTDKYCNSCFESEEEHKQSVIDDDDYDDERLYIEEEMISYCLNNDVLNTNSKDDIGELLKELDTTKLYYAVMRCLEFEPNKRYYLYI